MSSEEPRSSEQPREPLISGEVRVVGLGGLAQKVETAAHLLTADEPTSVGGTDSGPNPYELLLGALGACTAMTVRLYARRKGWSLDDVEVRLRHSRIHAEDCERCETEKGRIDRIEKWVTLRGDLDDDQRGRLLEISERCPIQKTLEGEIDIVSLP